MTYISCFSDFAFYFYYYFMENCHTWIIISKWENDLHTNTSRSVWPILYGLMIKMLKYKMYPAGELAVLRQLLLLARENTDLDTALIKCCEIQYSSGGFSKSPPNRWGWFFSPPRIFLIPHSNSHRDGFFVHRVSAEFLPQNHPLTCRTPRWAKVYPGELAVKD